MQKQIEASSSSASPLFHIALLALLLCVALSPSAGWTKVEYDSNQLMMKNAEEVAELVKKKIQRAQSIQASQELNDDAGLVAEPEAVRELIGAMRIAMSRPDQDGARTNLFSRIRRELQDISALDDALETLAQESIAALQDGKTPARRQATYILILENLMAELKPEISTMPSFKKIITDVRDANLKVSSKVRSQQMSRSMSKVTSPSETAAKILPKEKKKK
jgi:hypothetical protein